MFNKSNSIIAKKVQVLEDQFNEIDKSKKRKKRLNKFNQILGLCWGNRNAFSHLKGVELQLKVRKQMNDLNNLLKRKIDKSPN